MDRMEERQVSWLFADQVERHSVSMTFGRGQEQVNQV